MRARVRAPEARTRRRSGKSDPIDAHRAVTTALNLPVHNTLIGQINRLRALPRGGEYTDREPAANRAQLPQICDDLAPGLFTRPGIGPVSAAHGIVAFSRPGRCRHDGAFAELAGTGPTV
jgi:hypothetical protein